MENDQDCMPNQSDSLAKYDHDSQSWRTSQRCFLEGWAEYLGTWPRSGTTVSGIAYQLPQLAASKTETEYGLLPTLPATECKDFSRARILANLDKGGRVARRICSKSTLIHSEEMVGLNPCFAEVMAGYPIGWTELED